MLVSTPLSANLSNTHATERRSKIRDALDNQCNDRNLVMLAKENVAMSLADEQPSLSPRIPPVIPEDKLHRRNPQTVRREIPTFDDLIPETSLADVNLSEMPGLQNTEQWKRIAGRTMQASPPLSRQYYQAARSALELQEDSLPVSLGSYRRPGRTDNGTNILPTMKSFLRTPSRRVFLTSSIVVVLVVVTVAVVLAVTLSRKPSPSVTDFYTGSIAVRALYEPSLSNPKSPLARNYKREFCSLIGTTLTDTKTKYAIFYSTCNVVAFRNGSVIADFVLGFTRYQNVTRLCSFLNRTLVNQQLFGGTILSIALNSTVPIRTNQTDSTTDVNRTTDFDDNSAAVSKFTMTDPTTSPPNEQQPTRTTYTTVTYTTLDKGLSITISETITITNTTNDSSPINNNKNYELILVPTIDSTKTVVSSGKGTVDKAPAPIHAKSPSQPTPLRQIKPITETSFAYIDESSDDRTTSSLDESTLGDLATKDSTSSASTSSMNDGTLTNSTSTLTNNLILPIPANQTNEWPTKSTTSVRSTVRDREKEEEGEWAEEEEQTRKTTSRPGANQLVKRQRRMVLPKSQRRLLQYELMPTGKVYYLNRPSHHDNRPHRGESEENSSVALSTILSRSSSLDTLSDKRYHHHRHHHHHHHHPPHQPPQKYNQDLSTTKTEQKLSVGGRLASNNNLPAAASPFKPITANKKRFSSFEPTPESLDRVFDVLIAADRRREENEFWKERFDHRTASTRPTPSTPARTQDSNNSNTIPALRSRPPLSFSKLPTNQTLGPRSQSYTTKRASAYEAFNRPPPTIIDDCLRRRNLILEQQERNYSPNTIYSTNYPKQQLPPSGKPPLPSAPALANPVRILPVPNGRTGRAPQARQTSDELSSASDIWATRSAHGDNAKKPSAQARFQSVAPRSRLEEHKEMNSKRASSVEQQHKAQRKPTKHLSSKSKFFDLFKFNR